MPDFNTIDEVVEELQRGGMIVLVDERAVDVDGADLVGEGELVSLAEQVSPESINFMARHAGGTLSVPADPARIEQLHLEHSLNL